MHSFIRPNYERPTHTPFASSGTRARAIRVLAARIWIELAPGYIL